MRELLVGLKRLRSRDIGAHLEVRSVALPAHSVSDVFYASLRSSTCLTADCQMSRYTSSRSSQSFLEVLCRRISF